MKTHFTRKDSTKSFANLAEYKNRRIIKSYTKKDLLSKRKLSIKQRIANNLNKAPNNRLFVPALHAFNYRSVSVKNKDCFNGLFKQPPISQSGFKALNDFIKMATTSSDGLNTNNINNGGQLSTLLMMNKMTRNYNGLQNIKPTSRGKTVPIQSFIKKISKTAKKSTKVTKVYIKGNSININGKKDYSCMTVPQKFKVINQNCPKQRFIKIEMPLLIYTSDNKNDIDKNNYDKNLLFNP